MTNETYERIISTVDFAFQPIVNSFSGEVFAYEALLRNYRECGYDSIFDIFDEAYDAKLLYNFEIALRKKAIEKFTSIKDYSSKALFYNIDNRVLEMPDYSPGTTSGILNHFGLRKSNFYFELSERYEINLLYTRTKTMLEQYKKLHYKIVLDDYGSGYSGFQMLYLSEPDVIKIDRFFIDSIDKDIQKKFFTEQIVSMAHIMGTKVVAEGVETIEEINICRDIGCDLLQGYKVQKPQIDVKKLQDYYKDSIFPSGSINRRKSDPVNSLIIKGFLTDISVPYDSSPETIISLFNKNVDLSVLPVVNYSGQPVGIINEKDIKKYLYTGNGYYLFINKFHSEGIDWLIDKVPVVEINITVEKLLRIAATKNKIEGIIITENGKYKGLIDPFSLLKIVNERKLIQDRDQNPLTKMPGIGEIHRQIENLYNLKSGEKSIIIIDIRNFRNINNKYGFRLGDRIIIFLAEVIKKNINLSVDFAGHYGGDNFFIIPGKLKSSKVEDCIIRNIKIDFNEGLVSILKDVKASENEDISLSVIRLKIDFSRLDISFNLLMERISDLRKKKKITVSQISPS